MKFLELDDWVFFTVVYGSPRRSKRSELCLDLGKVALDINLTWLLAGDFNVMLNDKEKKRG